jgi:hypothetical protein
MIDIQEAYIERLRHIRYRPSGKNSAGLRYDKCVRAARKDAILKLRHRGYDEDSARQIVKDAHDMYELEQISMNRGED